MATKFTKAPAYYLLNRMKDLRTLILIQCNNLPFIRALNPDLNPSKVILCPNLEELILYVEGGSFDLPELMSTTKERALGGTKLPSIIIIGLGELVPGREVFRLKEHVSRVDYRFREEHPSWDNISEDWDD